MFRIVVGFDGSPAATRALEAALSLTKRIESAEVLVVTAEGPEDISGLESVLRKASRFQDRKKLQLQAATLTAMAKRTIGYIGRPTEFIVEGGPPARSIVRLAIQRRASLIVIGRTRRARFVDTLVGSVTDRVLRQSPIPVMVVPGAGSPMQELEHFPETHTTRVLVATDGSTSAHAALDYCRAFALALGKVQCFVLTVEPSPLTSGVTIVEGIGAFLQLAAAAEETGRQVLRQAGRRLAGLMPPARLLNKMGQPGSVIHRVAQEVGAQTIVIGSRSRGRLARSVLGSTSAYVAHNANVPVLVVRARQA